MQALNPLTMPLIGQSLIEASAGTGKTYTITGLYLRYLLGMQIEGELNTPLSVEQILVVTFTDAATQEIKDRVRSRIIAARDALLGQDPKDELIEGVIAAVDDKHRAFDLLDAAAKSMDEAAIFTIHGFCQRMLKQHAFESGVAFNLEFILDERDILLETIKDFWRAFVYPLNKERTDAILDVFAAPESLFSQVSSVFNKANAHITPQINLDDVWQARDEYINRVPAFKRAVIDQEFIAAIKGSGLSGSKTPARKGSLAALEAFCASEDLFFEFGTSKYSFEVWSSENLSDAANYKKNQPLFTHPLLSQFDELAALNNTINQGLKIAIVQYASRWVKAAIVKRKQEQSVITPDDLLTNLHSALNGEQGDALAQKIAQLFPVAMIDEFQDTDPIQYGIFSKIYGQENTTLAMIGDPKQAIYGFRGADIFTYIGAKEAVQTEQQFTLGTNFRSSTDIVNSVNSLFGKHANSFIYNDAIPFNAVAAKGKKADETFIVDGKPATAFEFNVFVDEAADEKNKPTNKGVGQAHLATHFANKIVTLLEKAKQGTACIGNKPVSAADICILVRDRVEAQIMKKALGDAKISSVYLSRESVFSQELSHHLLNFLTALHGQYDESLLRGVLAGPLFCLSYNDIFALADDENKWQEHLNFFAQLGHIWNKQGAMAMLERLMSHNQLSAKWQGLGYNVERWLTDFRHLGEILQQKQIELEGTLRLLRWFAQKVSQQDGETVQVRLESDANLVKIVTMHASKGLEYPLVFMPFASGYRETKEALYHDKGKLVYDLSKNEDALQKAEQERLAEDLRLLYVALTRAVHFCSLGVYNIGQGQSSRLAIQSSALGHVLFSGLKLSSSQVWRTHLSEFCDTNKAMSYQQFTSQTLLEQGTLRFAQSENSSQALSINSVTATIERDWRATSFSALSFKKHTDHIEPGRSDEDHEKDEFAAQEDELPSPYSFPKGAKPGSCLHEIFEQIDFTSPLEHPTNKEQNLDEVVKRALEKYHISESWQYVTEQWILDSLQCPLNANSSNDLSLSKLAPSDCLVEMEFNLPLSSLSAPKLNEILIKHFGFTQSKLEFANVKGLLKGFIDLIFCYQGKYYILDYKSNYLGNTPADYKSDLLEQAMSSHQYHLQYLIYTVALHRLLKQRISDYSIETHLGGVYYTFLRGMPAGQGVYFKKLTQEQVTILDGLFSQGAML
ncbi:exodeoxyribonuclease V beta subunit [Pseudoalteromonas carrageenovora]|uniref:RecBCD enzyme subunit RecB n=1 Tax=Pseudoalteromonas carrageenovora IAM 12662 TaxID=1314868 RepID=A0A2K4XAA4_PSEVC|nr:exodeoxyribonuclease V subunit beta [Pseudoalteromonas carrageenovora]MBE0381275.1 exodeoxyribonuclease V beta subunit [Pseudoalteromonas carrageenovora IAM 12662]QBJ72137.1 exodeoxyribonuclease V beta subunit [Pseudoalteromonas carrageenovora]GEB72922.1 RecBCD enzyme subunit RecB [Pseudoalteromonas carrageenovora]SOU41245.1 RecBCD enzyme subunit RecB [Pseudoalteromonas carrageenovora IAM 12662]